MIIKVYFHKPLNKAINQKNNNQALISQKPSKSLSNHSVSKERHIYIINKYVINKC